MSGAWVRGVGDCWSFIGGGGCGVDSNMPSLFPKRVPLAHGSKGECSGNSCCPVDFPPMVGGDAARFGPSPLRLARTQTASRITEVVSPCHRQPTLGRPDCAPTHGHSCSPSSGPAAKVDGHRLPVPSRGARSAEEPTRRCYHGRAQWMRRYRAPSAPVSRNQVLAAGPTASVQRRRRNRFAPLRALVLDRTPD